MATYHCSVKVMKRSAGRSATAASAYRSGSRIECEREGRVHDYTRKQHVDAEFILSPENAPDWTQDRSALWNRVELAEKRQDAQVAREVEVALPREVPKEAQEQLVRDFVKENFTACGMVADVAIHRPTASDGMEQPHAHIMLTMRPLDGDNFASKKDRSWNDKQLVEDWRESWGKHVNQAYEKVQLQERVDHRSYERQGKEEAPTVHLGPVNHAKEKRGVRTEKGDHNRLVRKLNAAYRLTQRQFGVMAAAVKYVMGPKKKAAPAPEIHDPFTAKSKATSQLQSLSRQLKNRREQAQEKGKEPKSLTPKKDRGLET